jgi:hypothetical protein
MRAMSSIGDPGVSGRLIFREPSETIPVDPGFSELGPFYVGDMNYLMYRCRQAFISGPGNQEPVRTWFLWRNDPSDPTDVNVSICDCGTWLSSIVRCDLAMNIPVAAPYVVVRRAAAFSDSLQFESSLFASKVAQLKMQGDNPSETLGDHAGSLAAGASSSANVWTRVRPGRATFTLSAPSGPSSAFLQIHNWKGGTASLARLATNGIEASVASLFIPPAPVGCIRTNRHTSSQVIGVAGQFDVYP